MGCLKLHTDHDQEPSPFLGVWKGDRLEKTDPHFFEVLDEKGRQQIFCIDYYPYGLTFNHWNASTQGGGQSFYTYNGFEKQALLGWFDYQARYYDPELGRFLMVDPLASKMSRYSPYSYAFDNPIYFTDPDGMEPEGGPNQTIKNVVNGMWKGLKGGAQSAWWFMKASQPGTMESVQLASGINTVVNNPREVSKGIYDGISDGVENWKRASIQEKARMQDEFFGEALLGYLGDKGFGKLLRSGNLFGDIGGNNMVTPKSLGAASNGMKIPLEFGPGTAKVGDLRKWEVKVGDDAYRINYYIQKGVENWDPIDVVQHKGNIYVVDGHHRLAAAKELGLESMPVNYLTERQAVAQGRHMGMWSNLDALAAYSNMVNHKPDVVSKAKPE